MKFSRALPLIFSLLLCVTNISAQKAEITISFSEQFFDALLDAMFQHSAPPEFSLAQNGAGQMFAGRNIGASERSTGMSSPCNETIKLMRENDGVRTAVRFRDGRILAPLAFSGNYNPPLIGCVAFGGWAQTVIDLEFDRTGQRLIARAHVQNVSLSGTGGVGGNVIARMVQSSLDKKINPIELVRTDKVSFTLPMKNASGLQMTATGFTHEIVNGQLNVRIAYEFSKAN